MFVGLAVAVVVELVAGTLAPAEDVVGAVVVGVPRELVLGFVPLALVAAAVPEGGAPVDAVLAPWAALAACVGELLVIAVGGRVRLPAGAARRVANCADASDETEASDRGALPRALPSRPCVLPETTRGANLLVPAR